ncbi:rhomboid family serine protease [Lachnospiraceae bacterium KM106-2]|nr:rhomboid family serine protease [Lachnospiraceae bacterium KM106-2]
MINQIEGLLLHSNFIKKQTNMPEVTIFEQYEGGMPNVIVLFDLRRITCYPEQYWHITNQIQNSYGIKPKQYLNILCCNSVDEVRDLTQLEEMPQWIADSSSKKLMIYENQGNSFSEIRQELEGLLQERHFEPKKQFKRLPMCTLFLILVNIVIFILVEITGGSNNIGNMVRWGASEYYKIADEHQYYRFFTNMFLHFGVEHLFNNMLVLFLIGERLEQLLGKWKYLFLYLVTGIMASIGSFLYYIQIDELNVVSAGASGAIFGVVGAITAFIILNKGRVSDITPQRIIFFVVISFYMGLQGTEVDNAAHISGFVSGVILMLIMYWINKKKQTKKEGIA